MPPKNTKKASPKNSAPTDIENLPAELLRLVFSKLPLPTLLKAILVSRKWRDVAEDYSLWNPALLESFRSQNGRESKLHVINNPTSRLPGYVMREMTLNRWRDPVSRLARNEITLAEQETLSRLRSVPPGPASDAWLNLNSLAVQAYTMTNKMPISIAMYLRKQERHNLESAGVRFQIEIGRLTFEAAKNITEQQRCNLNSPIVLNYITRGVLTFNDALNLRVSQFSNLENPGVQKYLKNKLNIRIAMNLNSQQAENLKSLAIQKLIDNGKLTFEQGLHLESHEFYNLNGVGVQKLIEAGVISIPVALNMTETQRDNLNNDAIMALLEEGIITFDMAFHLTPEQRANLESYNVQHLIRIERISLQIGMDLTRAQRINLESKTVQKLIFWGVFTLDQGMNLNSKDYLAIFAEQTPWIVFRQIVEGQGDDPITRIIDTHVLSEAEEATYNDVVNIVTHSPSRIVKYDFNNKAHLHLKAYIATGFLDAETLIHLDASESDNLKKVVVRAFVIIGLLPIKKALYLSREARANLEDPTIQGYIEAKKITVDDAISLARKALIEKAMSATPELARYTELAPRPNGLITFFRRRH